jgi:predicted NBD/HSP70 family sugar kinase
MTNRVAKKQAGRNLSDIKMINRSVIFRTIREAETISRSDLAKQTGLNPATITHITRELLDQGLIIEAGPGESRGGRPSSLLQIHAQHAYIIAVRLSRHNIQAILTDLNLDNVIRRMITSSSLAHPADISIPAMLELIESLIQESGLDRQKILGIGICAPGPLDARQGILYEPPNFPGWPSTPIRQIVEAEMGFPTFVDNDANAAALAEKLFGSARELDNYVYILIEDGVGGGLMVNGDIYRGEYDVAGEIGHMTIDFNGPQCDCGNFGCLELYASPGSVEDRVRQALLSGRSSQIEDLVHGRLDEVTFDLVVQAALASDPLAQEAIQTFTDALTVGIVNVINTFDPQAVIIGGKIGVARELIFEQLQQQTSQRLMPRGAKSAAILFSKLNSDAPLIGAFSLVLHELFQNPAFQAEPERSVNHIFG